MTKKTSRRLFIKQSGATALSVLVVPNTFRAQLQQGAAGLKTDVPADKLIADLETYVPELMKQTNVPGVSVALIRDAKIFWTQGFGVKSVSTKEPISADTPFEAGTLGIPAFAYATLKLSDDGKLNLDAPLWNYLPDYFLPANDPNSKLITARMLLAHTSGLRFRSEDKKIKFASTPGQKWFFTILGVAYLQRVIEHITGEPLEVFMQKNVLHPLGMQNSSYDWNDKYDETAARGHNEEGERVTGKNFYERYRRFSTAEKERIRANQPEDSAPGAGFTLTSTPTDYARFMIEVMQPTRKEKSGSPNKLIGEMLKPQAKVRGAVEWGLGWGIEHTPEGDAFWHWGSATTLKHFVIGYQKQSIGAIIMTNSANGLKLCKELTPRAIGGEYSSFSLLLK